MFQGISKAACPGRARAQQRPEKALAVTAGWPGFCASRKLTWGAELWTACRTSKARLNSHPEPSCKGYELPEVGFVWLYSLWTTEGNLCQLSTNRRETSLTTHNQKYSPYKNSPEKPLNNYNTQWASAKPGMGGSDYQSHHIHYNDQNV